MITLKLGNKEAGIVRDALLDAAIALRTDPQTGVVISEQNFLQWTSLRIAGVATFFLLRWQSF